MNEEQVSGNKYDELAKTSFEDLSPQQAQVMYLLHVTIRKHVPLLLAATTTNL